VALHRLAPLAHGLWVFVEPALHRLEDVLMVPSGDPALFGWCTLALDRAAWTSGGPITT
jgi:hypothetical protein